MTRPKLISLWLPPILWSALIFWFSSLPTTPTSAVFWQDFLLKKSAHVFEYGVLAVLVYRALWQSGVRKRRAGLWAILFVIFYGLTDEFHQSFTPGREPRLRDTVFDTIGGVLAIYLIWKLLPKAPKRLKDWAKNWQLL